MFIKKINNTVFKSKFQIEIKVITCCLFAIASPCSSFNANPDATQLVILSGILEEIFHLV